MLRRRKLHAYLQNWRRYVNAVHIARRRPGMRKAANRMSEAWSGAIGPAAVVGAIGLRNNNNDRPRHLPAQSRLTSANSLPLPD